MGSDSEGVLGDYFDLQRGTTYKSGLKGLPGPILLGLASIQRNGGFRSDNLTTYGGESPSKLLVMPGELFASLKDVTQAGDLLGAVAKLPSDSPPGRLTQDTVKLVPKTDTVQSDYLYWVLRAPQTRELCKGRATGTTNLGLARDDFLSIPVPALTSERRQLVEVLGALDDKIELNRKMNRTLEAMAQALFKSRFIDFDGVPDSDLVESELGPIPKGWSWIPFEKAGQWVSGGTPNKKREDYWGGDIPWFSAKSLGPVWLQESEDRVTALGAVNGTRLVPRRSVIFLVRGMSLASEFRIGITAREATLNQDLKAIVDNGSVLPELLLLWLFANREAIRLQADEAGHGTKRLPTTVLHAWSMAMPKRAEQERMAAPLCALLSRIEANQSETKTLATLRDTLLPKLISGEVRVPEAETAVEAVL